MQKTLYLQQTMTCRCDACGAEYEQIEDLEYYEECGEGRTVAKRVTIGDQTREYPTGEYCTFPCIKCGQSVKVQ